MTSKSQGAEIRPSVGGSTGPKSVAGKARSRLNATKHGLTSQPLPGQFHDEIADIQALLRPDDATHDASWRAAEAHHRVAAIRAVRQEILARAAGDVRSEAREGATLDDETIEAEALIRCLGQLAKLDDYQRRALSIRRKAFRRLIE